MTSLAVSPSNPSVAVGGKQAMTATATLVDNSQVTVTVLGTWTSSASAVATASNTAGSQGTVTGVAAGTSTITFSYQGASASATVTVSGGTTPSPSPSPSPATSPSPSPAASPSPSPGSSPTPSPSTVNTTISNSNAWKVKNNGLQLNSSARKPSAPATYVYVGNSGTIMTSDDTQSTFTYQVSGTTVTLTKVIWVGPVANITVSNQNNFIALGSGTTILTSPDGVTWTQVSLAANAALNTALGNNTTLTGIATVSNGPQGSGFFICGQRRNNTAGQPGTLLFTTDIKDATKYIDISLGMFFSDVDFTDCAYGNIGGANQNIFEAVSPTTANGGAAFEVVADNTLPTNNFNMNSSAAHPMAYISYCPAGAAGANACFVAAGTNNPIVGASVTGGGGGWANNVTSSTGAFAGPYQLTNATALNATGVAFASIGAGPTDTAIIAGNIAGGPTALLNSTFPNPNGAAWVNTGVSFKFDATNSFAGNGALISGISASASAPNPFTTTAVGSGVLSATDGKAYTVKHYASSVQANGACVGTVASAPFYVTVGNADFLRSNPTITTSTDGQNWTSRLATNLGFQNMNAVIQAGPANGLKFVAVGASVLATSTDGINWTGSTTALTQTYRAVAFGNGKFVAVGDSGWVQTSTDGLTWTAAAQTGNGNPSMKGIAFGAGTFVAVADAGVVLKSSDGVTWTPAASSPLGSAPNLRAITFATNTFIAVGASGTVARSTDGSTFNPIAPISPNMLNAIAFVSTPNGSGSTSTLFAAGASGDIRVSSDLGLTWTAATSGTNFDLFAAFATSTSTSSTNTTTNVTTNTFTQIFGVGGVFDSVLMSR